MGRFLVCHALRIHTRHEAVPLHQNNVLLATTRRHLAPVKIAKMYFVQQGSTQRIISVARVKVGGTWTLRTTQPRSARLAQITPTRANLVPRQTQVAQRVRTRSTVLVAFLASTLTAVVAIMLPITLALLVQRGSTMTWTETEQQHANIVAVDNTKMQPACARA